MVTIDEIIDYIFHTPYNTNKKILREMLEDLVVSSGGEVPEDHIIYDGGAER